jgi:hypothetical protein
MNPPRQTRSPQFVTDPLIVVSLTDTTGLISDQCDRSVLENAYDPRREDDFDEALVERDVGFDFDFGFDLDVLLADLLVLGFDSLALLEDFRVFEELVDFVSRISPSFLRWVDVRTASTSFI